MTRRRGLSHPAAIRMVLVASVVATSTVLPAVAKTDPAGFCRPTPYLVTANTSSNVVTMWNTETFERVSTIPLKEITETPRESSFPIGTWPTPDGRTVMVFNGNSADLDTIDVETMSVVRNTPLPIGNSFADRASPIQDDGALFWLTTYPPTPNLYAIDIATGEIARSFPDVPVTFANSRDGEVIYFASGGLEGGLLEVRDSTSLELIGSVETLGSRVNVSPDDTTLFIQGPALPTGAITGYETYVVDAVDVSDRAHPELLARIPVPAGSWPGAFSPDGRQFWVPFTDSPFVRVIDTSTYTSRDIYTGHSGQGVAITEDGKAFVTVSPQPIPPQQGVSALATYFGSIPGGAAPGSSAESRPFDSPGAVFVYDTTTLEPLGQIQLPSNAFMPAIIERPPPVALDDDMSALACGRRPRG